MRVLFACVPAYGHLHPLLPLARALAAAGDEVTIASGPDVATSIEAAGLRSCALGPPYAEWFAEIGRRGGGQLGDGLPIDRILPYFVPRLFAEVGAQFMVDGLVAAAAGTDLLIFESFAFAGPLAAAVAGVPAVHHLLGPPVPEEAMALAADAISPLRRRYGQDYARFAGAYEVPTIAICPPALGASALPDPPEVLSLRPVPIDAWGDAVLPDWVATLPDRPTVYVTLGTVVNQNRGIFTAVLEALAGEAVNVIVTVGQANDPAALGPLPPNARAERYIPQSQLLPHCALVISHGGSGTLFATLAQGLPTLMIPQGADQFVNAELCAAARVAERLLPSEVTSDAIRDRTRALLGASPAREAAGRVAQEIAAMPGPDEVAGQLRPFVDRLRAHDL
ncbi:MAG TPA: glycosyltransferase [Actinomycetota bacterium]|nr:glycosyltransferase [Actinomycetota bacterium]